MEGEAREQSLWRAFRDLAEARSAEAARATAEQANAVKTILTAEQMRTFQNHLIWSRRGVRYRMPPATRATSRPSTRASTLPSLPPLPAPTTAP